MILDEIKKLKQPFEDWDVDVYNEVISKNTDLIKLSDIEKILAEKCRWKLEDDESNEYRSGCTRDLFCFTYGDWKENKFKYCPYCGKEIQEVKDEN